MSRVHRFRRAPASATVRVAAGLLLLLAGVAGAQSPPGPSAPVPPAPPPETAEQVFRRSLQENIDQTVSPRHLLAFGCAMLGLIIAAAVFNRWRARSGRGPLVGPPRAINSPSKLVREVARGVNLRPAEVKQLKVLSEQQNVSNPLVLLLCPSVLSRAVRENPKRVDREVLSGLAKKIARR
jgi:hypothetical protein